MDHRTELDTLTRTLGREAFMARRIRTLRLDRTWSQAELAKRMADAGCPIHQSAISKIESPKEGEGRRAIAVDEALAFARCFEVTLAELLLPEGATDQLEGMLALVNGPDLERAFVMAELRVNEAARTVARVMEADVAMRQIVAADAEETATEAAEQGRALEDSVRWAFFCRVHAMTESEDRS